jgi:Pectate lyase
MIKFLAILLSGASFAMSGESPAGSSGSAPSHRKPKSGAVVYAPKGAWTIRDDSVVKLVKGSTITRTGGALVWDLKGAILDGKNQKGNCDQNENNEPLFRASTPLILKNGFIRNAKNAATFSKKDSGVERMTWLNICEDAVATNKGAENFRVIGSEFMNVKQLDKSIQLNEAKGALVKGNLVYGGATCMRIGASDVTSVSDTAHVSGNRFVGCRDAIHASKITVFESSNKFENVKEQRVTANGAKFK